MIMKTCPVCKGAGYVTRSYCEPDAFTERCLVCNGVGELLMPYVKPQPPPVVERSVSAEEVFWNLANKKAFSLADVHEALYGLHLDYRRFLKDDMVRLRSGWYITGKMLREQFDNDCDKAIRHFKIPMPQEYYIPTGVFTEEEFSLIVKKNVKKRKGVSVGSALYFSKKCLRIGMYTYCHVDTLKEQYGGNIETARKEWENHMKSKYVQGQYVLYKEKEKCVVIDTPSYSRATYRLKKVDGGEDVFAPWWDLATWEEK
jgi:hypothetical protein